MEFEFSSEQQELREQVRRFLTDRCDRKAVRAILDGPESFDKALWKGLAELGLLGATIPEAYGGMGAGYLEACVIAEELGRALAPVPYQSSIAQAAECLMLAGTAAQKERDLPLMVRGELIGTLALAEKTGKLTPSSVQTQARRGGDGSYRLTGFKPAVIDGDVADFAVVLARDDAAASGAGLSLFRVDLSAAGVTRSSVESIDPTRSHAALRFDQAPAELLGQNGQGWSVLETVLDRAAVLMAFEQIGGADRALYMARDYALERFAFGRPIGSLQAIKHMLADMYVSATLARSNGYYAAWALSTGADELPLAAASARVSATQAYQHCARNNTQVHGGMGFTWEFDCHLHYRRSNLLALCLGSQSVWENKLVDRLAPKAA